MIKYYLHAFSFASKGLGQAIYFKKHLRKVYILSPFKSIDSQVRKIMLNISMRFDIWESSKRGIITRGKYNKVYPWLLSEKALFIL
jgi:hypothetical protein